MRVMENRLEKRREMRQERRNGEMSPIMMQSGTTTETNRENRLRMRNATSTERVAEVRTETLQRARERVTRLMSSTINRLEKISDRVESRIKKQKNAGLDVVEAEKLVADSKMHLEEAKMSLESIKQIDSSTGKLKDNLQNLRKLASETKKHLKNARESLSKAVVILAKNSGNKSPTNTTETPSN
jgi:DNA anti-recombination protein RmuC